MTATADLMAKIKERRKRRKIVYVGEDWIRRLLRMPEDIFIERIDYDVLRQSWIIICSNPNWPVVPDYVEPPTATGHMTPVHVQGKHFGLEDADKEIIVMSLAIDWSTDVHNQ
jgi:hypothetical protein